MQRYRQPRHTGTTCSQCPQEISTSYLLQLSRSGLLNGGIAGIRRQLDGNMKASVDSAGGHHLLKHTAPSIERVVECFDGAPVKEISKLIMRMGQRELQVGVPSPLRRILPASHAWSACPRYDHYVILARLQWYRNVSAMEWPFGPHWHRTCFRSPLCSSPVSGRRCGVMLEKCRSMYGAMPKLGPFLLNFSSNLGRRPA